MKKFMNKYRIPSTRLQNWDYGSNAAYFITICIKNRDYCFGNISNGKMYLSDLGIVADKFWLEIPEHFPFVKLDVHIVMPNHVHGILFIDKRISMDIEICVVETQNLASLRVPLSPFVFQLLPNKNVFGPQSKNLGSIISGYKIGVTKYAKNNNLKFYWQSRFYDHVIRNANSYRRIRQYIIDNPKNWDNDKFKRKGYV
jgi:REP element-mobilizing transposase RayT